MKFKKINMKKLILLSITVAFCFTAKAQTDSVQLAKGVIAALRSSKVENLQRLVAPPDFYRVKFKETVDLSDEQIIEKTSKNPKLIADFEKLLADAKEKKVDISDIKYESSTAELMPGGPVGISITFYLGPKTGKIAISAMEYKGKWYLMEIILTSRAFRDF